MLTRNAAKAKLKNMGLSYRKAAPLLGVTYPHLSYVLNGHRDSKRLLKAIAELSVHSQERSRE
jgi:predicted transcriptional regulator